MEGKDLDAAASLFSFHGNHITNEAHCGSKCVYCLVMFRKALRQKI